MSQPAPLTAVIATASLLAGLLCAPALADPPALPLRVLKAAPADDERPAVTAKVEQRLIELSNEYRHAEGRKPLATQPELTKAASEFARFMAEHDKYGHTADDRQPADRVVAAGYEYCVVEENIAFLVSAGDFGTRELAQLFFDNWRASAPHRENLLSPQTSEIGVGVAYSPKTRRYYAVQNFGRPKSAQIVFEVANPTQRGLKYTIDDQEFELPQRYSRQHTRCTPPTLSFVGAAASSNARTFRPDTGARFVVSEAAEGQWTIELGKMAVEQAKIAPPTAAEKPKPAAR